MQRTISIGRTARPRFNVYTPDGLGRDTYISTNNGGFWGKDNKDINFVPSYPVYHKRVFHSLRHDAAPFRYYSDGNGRDSYILDRDGGLRHDHKALAQYHLKDFLRTPEQCLYDFQDNPTNKNGIRIKTHFLSKREWLHNEYLRKIQNGTVKRLYTAPNEKLKESFKTDSLNKARRNYVPTLRIYDDDGTMSLTQTNFCNYPTLKDFDPKDTKKAIKKIFDAHNKNTGKNYTDFYKNTDPKPVLPVPKYKKRKVEHLEAIKTDN